MALQTCNECGHQVSQFARWCPGCGCPGATSAPLRISLTDMEIPFPSLVALLFKTSLAFVPVALAYGMVAMVLSVLFTGIMRSAIR